MKKNPLAEIFPQTAAWRRWSAAAALLCAAAGMPTVYAADAPGDKAAGKAVDEAMLNFVGADIESVIKAVGHYTNTTFIIDPRVKGGKSIWPAA